MVDYVVVQRMKPVQPLALAGTPFASYARADGSHKVALLRKLELVQGLALFFKLPAEQESDET